MTTASGAKVELFYSDAWHDITSDVRIAGGITITRGRGDEAQQVSPGTCTLTLDNTDGKYSPRNPESSLYGLIGRNTKIRVRWGSVTTEDFEDSTLAFTSTGGNWVQNTVVAGRNSSGSYGAQRGAAGTLDEVITLPDDTVMFSFWWRENTSNNSVSILIDGDVVLGPLSGPGTTKWTEQVLDVSDTSTITLRLTTSGLGNMFVDDFSFFTGPIRFVGEVESWPSRWDSSNSVGWVPITAYGELRRLGGVGTTARTASALRRTVDLSSPTAHWAFDEGQLADALAPTAGAGAGPFEQIQGASVFGQNEVAPWIGTGLSLSRGELTTIVSAGAALNPTSRLVADVAFSWALKGEPSFRLTIGSDPKGEDDALWRVNVDGSGLISWANETASLNSKTGNVVDGLHHLRMDVSQSGSDAVQTIYLDGVAIGTAFTASSYTLAEYSFVVLTYDDDPDEDNIVTFSNLAVYVDTTPPTDAADATFGHAGETTKERLARLADEDDITTTVIGDASTLLGAQPVGSPLSIRQDCTDADGGIFGEDRSQLGLTYVAYDELLNPFTAALTLDYDESEVTPPLEPVEDTQHVLNDVTVTRTNGSSTRLVQETGPLNVQEPSDDADGVGRYATDVTLNLYKDSQTRQQAAWLRHVGTWPDPRYPTITVDITGLEERSKTTLADAALAVDIGDLITITNPPKWAGADSIGAIVQGYTEVIGSHHHTITYNCSPARLWFVNALGSSRLDTGGSVTAEALDTTETGIDVTNTGAGWSTTTPYDITIGGEHMTVTGVSGTGSSQTLTVTRSVNGVTKSHASAADVSLYLPSRLGR